MQDIVRDFVLWVIGYLVASVSLIIVVFLVRRWIAKRKALSDTPENPTNPLRRRLLIGVLCLVVGGICYLALAPFAVWAMQQFLN